MTHDEKHPLHTPQPVAEVQRAWLLSELAEVARRQDSLDPTDEIGFNTSAWCSGEIVAFFKIGVEFGLLTPTEANEWMQFHRPGDVDWDKLKDEDL